MIKYKVLKILADILDIKENGIDLDTDLVRNLNVESIDFLEIALSLEREFHIKVDENKIFLKSFRYYMDKAREKNKDYILQVAYIKNFYPFLSESRILELIHDFRTQIMPSIKIKDIISYVQWTLGKSDRKKEKYKKI